MSGLAKKLIALGLAGVGVFLLFRLWKKRRDRRKPEQERQRIKEEIEALQKIWEEETQASELKQAELRTAEAERNRLEQEQKEAAVDDYRRQEIIMQGESYDPEALESHIADKVDMFDQLNNVLTDFQSPQSFEANIFECKTDIESVVQEALGRANEDNKYVLLLLALNQDPWSKAMHDVLSDAQIQDYTSGKFETVLINYETEAEYCAQFAPDHTPWLVVLDKEGSVIANQNTFNMEDDQAGYRYDQGLILSFLQGVLILPGGRMGPTWTGTTRQKKRRTRRP